MPLPIALLARCLVPKEGLEPSLYRLSIYLLYQLEYFGICGIYFSEKESNQGPCCLVRRRFTGLVQVLELVSGSLQ